MNIYLAEAEEAVRRHHAADRSPRARHPRAPHVTTRSRVAGSLRRVADRLEQ